VFRTCLGEVSDDGGVGVLQGSGRLDEFWNSGLCAGILTNKSSRVIPGFRGTPAGMTTISAPLRAEAMLR
jgi:hypothetical protein